MNTINIPSSASVLIVEDNEERINYFKRWMRPEDGKFKATIAMTPQKAINVLGVHRFDIIFLDHDTVPMFVEPTDPDHDNKTFWKVAELLARTKYPGIVIIHSHNPVGAKRMNDLLTENGVMSRCIPFGQFKIEQT